MPVYSGTTGKESVPLNLETLFGDRYRVSMSEDHEPGMHRDPWNFEIVGVHGKVYAYGKDQLCAFADGRYIKGKLLALGTPHQVGQDEVVIRFKQEAFPAVAKLLRLYRRKRLSEEQRAVAVERLAAVRRKVAG